MTTLMEIMAAVGRERRFQDEKYGPVLRNDYKAEVVPATDVTHAVQGPGGHELAAWLLVIEKELDEAKDAAVHGGFAKPTGRNTVRQELIQIMAVCAAALEQHGVTE